MQTIFGYYMRCARFTGDNIMQANLYHATQAAQYRGDARFLSDAIRDRQAESQFTRGNYYQFNYCSAAEYTQLRGEILSELRELRNQMRIAQLLSELHRQFC